MIVRQQNWSSQGSWYVDGSASFPVRARALDRWWKIR
jgi:hypothetical protein